MIPHCLFFISFIISFLKWNSFKYRWLLFISQIFFLEHIRNSQAATGRGVSPPSAWAHEGCIRPVPSQRHRVPRDLRKTCCWAAGLRYLRGGTAGRLDGPVVLRRHVLDADATWVPQVRIKFKKKLFISVKSTESCECYEEFTFEAFRVCICNEFLKVLIYVYV